MKGRLATGAVERETVYERETGYWLQGLLKGRLATNGVERETVYERETGYRGC